MSVTEWDVLQADWTAWGKKTFPHATLSTILAHLRAELKEVEDNPKDPLEWADVLMLILQAAHREGFTMEHLFEACETKFQINQQRQWGKPNSEGFSEHIKGD